MCTYIARNRLLHLTVVLGFIGLAGCGSTATSQAQTAPAEPATETVAAAPAPETPAVPATPDTAAAVPATTSQPAETPAPAQASAITPPPAIEAPPAARPAAPAERKKPLSADEIQAVVRRMIKHPRVLYRSATSDYNYYVGGALNAEYNPQQSILKLSSDQRASSDGPACEYTADGKLKLSGKDSKANLDAMGACNQLMDQLTGFLKQ